MRSPRDIVQEAIDHFLRLSEQGYSIEQARRIVIEDYYDPSDLTIETVEQVDGVWRNPHLKGEDS